MTRKDVSFLNNEDDDETLLFDNDYEMLNLIVNPFKLHHLMKMIFMQ